MSYRISNTLATDVNPILLTTFAGFITGPLPLGATGPPSRVLNSDGTQLQIPENYTPVSCLISQAGSVGIVSSTLSVTAVALGTTASPLEQFVVLFDTASVLTPVVKAGGVCLPFTQYASSGNTYLNVTLVDSASVGLLAGNILAVKIQCIN